MGDKKISCTRELLKKICQFSKANNVITWITALQNSNEFKNMASSGVSLISSGVNWCQSSATSGNLRGNKEYNPLSPVARTLNRNIKKKYTWEQIKLRTITWEQAFFKQYSETV